MNKILIELLVVCLIAVVLPTFAEEANINENDIAKNKLEESSPDGSAELVSQHLADDENEDELLHNEKRYRLAGGGKRYRLAPSKRYRLAGKRYRLSGGKRSDLEENEEVSSGDLDGNINEEKRYRLMTGKRYRLSGKRSFDEEAHHQDKRYRLMNQGKRYRLLNSPGKRYRLGKRDSHEADESQEISNESSKSNEQDIAKRYRLG